MFVFRLVFLKLFFLAFLLCGSAKAYFLDYFKAQHAGEIGELALGFGKRFGKVYSLDYLHGLVREQTGGTTITSIAIKNNFDLWRIFAGRAYLDLYAGITVYHVTGLRYQARRINRYPDSYYSIGSIKGLLYLGAKGGLKKNSPHQFYFESGINDLWLVNSVANPETVNPADYVSLAAGYAYLF